MRSGSLVLSFFTQQRPYIRPRKERQNWPTGVLFKTVPLQRPHTCDYKILQVFTKNNIPTHRYSIRQNRSLRGNESNKILHSPEGQWTDDLR